MFYLIHILVYVQEYSMKKIGLLLFLHLVLSLSLFASPSWIGVQGITWHSEQTATATDMGISSTSSGSDEGIGLIISGSLFLGSEYGLGFQFGATKNNQHDSPLAWRGALTIQYSSTISESISLEFGTGVLYERLTSTYSSSATEYHMTVQSYSLYSSTNIVFHLAGGLALVGSVSMALPLFTNAEVSRMGLTTNPEMHVTGFTVEALLGVALQM